eukprot:5889768-Pyramimonas_sp.AAC.1
MAATIASKSTQLLLRRGYRGWSSTPDVDELFRCSCPLVCVCPRSMHRQLRAYATLSSTTQYMEQLLAEHKVNVSSEHR